MIAIVRHCIHVMILWFIGDWNIVEYKLVGNEVEDYQLWKKHGGNLVSKLSDAVLGVHKTEGLVSFVESNEIITPISIDEAATSSYELLVPGMFHNILKFICLCFGKRSLIKWQLPLCSAAVQIRGEF